LILGVGDSLSAACGCLRGVFGCADGVCGLLGEKGAVALGVGVAFGDCGGDAGGAYVGRCGPGDWSREVAGVLATATGAMCGEALSYLFLESKMGLGLHFGFPFVPGFVER
jgi:hypothetical protein